MNVHTQTAISQGALSHSTLDDLWRPPAPSRATRTISRRPERGGSGRSLMVGGATPHLIQSESGHEGQFAIVALTRRDVVDVWEQPDPVSFVDVDGVRHLHTFDFLLRMSDGKRIAVAVKPTKTAEKHGWREKIAHIAAQAGHFADGFVLVTGKHLPRDMVRDARLILSCRRDDRPDDDARVRAVVAGLDGAATISDIVALSGLDGHGFRAVVRLVDVGVLEVADGTRIDYPTLVRRTDATATGDAP